MEISHFHKQGQYNRLKMMHMHVNYLDLSKRQFVEFVANFMEIECFFQIEDVEQM